MQVKADNIITADLADQALNLLDIDGDGLEEMDNDYSQRSSKNSTEDPLTQLSIYSVGEEAETLEEVYEPYLIQEGFLKRTRKGVATERAYNKFGLTPPECT